MTLCSPPGTGPGSASECDGAGGPSRPSSLLCVVLLATLATLATTVACDRRAPAVFGRACVDDGECDVEGGLVCDPVRHQCAPPRPPTPIPGLTCDDAHALELRDVGGLFAGTIDVELGAEPSPTPSGAPCADDEGRWVYARVEVPTPMAVRISAAGQGKVSVAVMNDACGQHLDHACAAGDDVTLPLVEGTVTIGVAASTGGRVTIAVEQLRCPAGFVPTESGCLGFLDLEGPTPRTGHQLTVVDEDAVVASNGTGADGTPASSQVFSRRALRWRELLDGAARTGHAAAATDGFFFAVGGTDELGSEILDPGTLRFFPRFQPAEAQGITDGTLTQISTDVPMLFVGGVAPVVALFFTPSSSCDDSFDCPPTFDCIAVLENSFDDELTGVCLCVADDCNRLIRELPDWIDLDSPPDLHFRQRHVAIDLEDDPEDALVVVTGGVVNTPDAPASPPASFVLLGDSLTWVQMPVEPAPRRDAVGASIGGGDVVLVGGRGSDEAPLDLVELWAPLLSTPPRVTRLARPRADFTGGLLGAPGVATTFIAIGGDDGDGPLATTELVDVVTGATRVGPALPFPLSGARAALLEDGDMLVVGGRSEGGALVETALLLTEIAPTLVKPDVGAGFSLPDTDGDFCEEALALEGASGSVEGNTIGFQDDLDTANDFGCSGVTSSRGFDVFFAIDVPAGGTVDFVLVDPISGADLVLAVYDECPVVFPCVDAVDFEVNAPETLSVSVGEATSFLVVVDGFIEDAPFNYRLEWTVTP